MLGELHGIVVVVVRDDLLLVRIVACDARGAVLAECASAIVAVEAEERAELAARGPLVRHEHPRGDGGRVLAVEHDLLAHVAVAGRALKHFGVERDAVGERPHELPELGLQRMAPDFPFRAGRGLEGQIRLGSLGRLLEPVGHRIGAAWFRVRHRSSLSWALRVQENRLVERVGKGTGGCDGGVRVVPRVSRGYLSIGEGRESQQKMPCRALIETARQKRDRILLPFPKGAVNY